MSDTAAAPTGTDPSSAQAAEMLGNIVIPPCPRIVLSMMEEARRPEPDFAKLDHLISGDVGLAAAVVKSANSPFFGLNHKVQAVKSALQVLGIRAVTTIVTQFALRQALGAPDTTSPFWDRFWDYTNYHAIACARLGRGLRFISADGAYTFGLFNDCGIPLLLKRFPDYIDTLELAAQGEHFFVELEHERHQASHTLVGFILARSWHLPELICQAIHEHHRFNLMYGQAEAGQDHIAALAALSLVADALINDFVGNPACAEWRQHGAQALAVLGLDDDGLQRSRDELENELREAEAYRR